MTGIIILAAGSSLRMGQPKQQLAFNGKTLLQHSIDAATGVPDAVVYVVLGANAQSIEKDIKDSPVKIIYNAEWESGMSSSVKAGINALVSHIDVQDALLMLCDQPFVDTALLQQIISCKPADLPYIIACRYGETIGVPALFSKNYFEQLLMLTGQQGAKKVINDCANNLITVAFEQGSIDIDTPEDYKNLPQNIK